MRSNLGSTPATVGSISSADITLPARTIPATIHVPDGGVVMGGGIRLDSSVESWRLYAADQDGVTPQGYFREGSMTRQSFEQYESPPENPFTPVVDFQALSTFAIDVDTASYANIRRFINQGQMPVLLWCHPICRGFRTTMAAWSPVHPSWRSSSRDEVQMRWWAQGGECVRVRYPYRMHTTEYSSWQR